MEGRPDTSSSSTGRFRGQWSFLANPPQHGQPQSLPPSSYVPHSDRSNISPLPTGLHYQAADASPSSLPRNLTTTSIGGRSNVTIPSQPVLIRVHSADASAHTNPAPRPRRSIKMSKRNGLPAISEFSIQGILAAIQEDAETDINTISEILGRSRLVLADQHDSHMPPQGEIRAMPNYLQAVEEASASSERLAADDVMILAEDASLIDGSQAGSAAYGLLERLQALPRLPRIQANASITRATPISQARHHSSPAIIQSSNGDEAATQHISHQLPTQLLQTSLNAANRSRTTDPVVSESHLYAAANGIAAGGLETVSGDSSFTPLEVVDEPAMIDRLSETNHDSRQQTMRERMQNILHMSDPIGLSAWLQGQSSTHDSQSRSAEGQLRNILER